MTKIPEASHYVGIEGGVEIQYEFELSETRSRIRLINPLLRVYFFSFLSSQFIVLASFLTCRSRGCLSFGWVVIISRLSEQEKQRTLASTTEPNEDELSGLLVGRARSATFFLPTTLTKLLLEAREF